MLFLASTLLMPWLLLRTVSFEFVTVSRNSSELDSEGFLLTNGVSFDTVVSVAFNSTDQQGAGYCS